MSFFCHRFDQNSDENIVRISALKFFVASWWLPGSFLGLPRDLVSNITKKEAYRKSPKASRKPQGSFKNFQERNPYNILLFFWSKWWHQKDILKLTDLYDIFKKFGMFNHRGLKLVLYGSTYDTKLKMYSQFCVKNLNMRKNILFSDIKTFQNNFWKQNTISQGNIL